MTPFNHEILQMFPLKSISDVVKLFKCYLETNSDPNLATLSIITGMVENVLTSKEPVVVNNNQQQNQTQNKTSATTNAAKQQTTATNNTTPPTTTTTSSSTTVVVAAAAGSSTLSKTSQQQQQQQQNNFPIIQIENVRNLYDKFKQIIVKAVESKQKSKLQYATREIIKRVSDVIWNSLTRNSHKDRAHLQNLYSYLVDKKLDCFGVALGVVAGCQILGYLDVHLAISEDHAWVVFGPTQEDTIEVTWHGKGAEDKRGHPVTVGYQSHSWLYLAGNPVICNRYMEIGAIVSSINPALSLTSECTEVADLQQQLLWLLYDLNHLDRYPMGLGCLGELEEISPIKIVAAGLNTTLTLLTNNMNSSTSPITSNTINNDNNAIAKRPTAEELYMESVESAKKFYNNHHVYPYTYLGGFYFRQHSYKDAFAAWANAGDVIRLYNYSRDDEEIYKEFLDIANDLIPNVMKVESSGHSGKSIVRDPHCFAYLLRFYDGICLWEEGSQTPILHIGWAKKLVMTISRFDCDIRSQVKINCSTSENGKLLSNNNNNKTNTSGTSGGGGGSNHHLHAPITRTSHEYNNNNITKMDIIGKSHNMDCGYTTSTSVAAAGILKDESSKNNVLSALEALTAACSEKIINPDFLLQGGGQLFAIDVADDNKQLQQNNSTNTAENNIDKHLNNNNGNGNEKINKQFVEGNGINHPIDDNNVDHDEDEYTPKKPIITLYSQKMKGIKDLLLSEKLNTHAISLQMTAQSQVQVGGKKSRGLLTTNNLTGISTSGNIGGGVSSNSSNSSNNTNINSNNNNLAIGVGGSNNTTNNYHVKRLRRE